MLCRENTDFIVVMTVLEVVELSLITSDSMYKRYVPRVCFLFNSSKSVAILSHGCLGSLELIIGSLTGSANFTQVEHFLTS